MQKIQTKEDAVRAHFCEDDQAAIFAQIPARTWWGDKHKSGAEDSFSIFEQEEHRHEQHTDLIYTIEHILEFGYDEGDWIADSDCAMAVNYYIRHQVDYCSNGVDYS